MSNTVRCSQRSAFTPHLEAEERRASSANFREPAIFEGKRNLNTRSGRGAFHFSLNFIFLKNCFLSRGVYQPQDGGLIDNVDQSRWGKTKMRCSIDEHARLAALYRYNILDTDPDASFDRITRLATMVLQTPIALVSLIDRDRQWFKSNQGLGVAETPRAVAFCARTIEDDDPFIVTNALEHPLFCTNPLVLGEPHIRFYIGVPLKMHDGHKIGTLCAIDQEPRLMSTEQISAFCDLARMVVDEIEYRQIATTDNLTDTLTRLGFDIKIARELERARRYHRGLSLIEFDTDYFKAVNDRYGHAAGDSVLRNVAAQVKQELRTVDFIGRQGGEEFVIALPETDIDGAMELAERIRKRIADTVVSMQTNEIRVTASFGISSFDVSDDGWADMLGRADAALYEAKKGGRNRCVRRVTASQIPLAA